MVVRVEATSPNFIIIISQLLYYNFLRISSSTSHLVSWLFVALLYSTWLIVAWHVMFCPTSSCYIDDMYNLWYMMYLSKRPSPKLKIISQLLYYNFLRISSSTSHTPPGYLWHCVVFYMVDCCMAWYDLSYFFFFYWWHVQSLLHDVRYLSKLSSPKFKIISQLLYYNFLRISSSTSHTPPGYLWHCVVFYMVDCCMGL